jgi:hypothetical protein
VFYIIALTTNDRNILIGYLDASLPTLLEMILPQIRGYLSAIQNKVLRLIRPNPTLTMHGKVGEIAYSGENSPHLKQH